MLEAMNKLLKETREKIPMTRGKSFQIRGNDKEDIHPSDIKHLYLGFVESLLSEFYGCSVLFRNKANNTEAMLFAYLNEYEKKKAK